MARIETTIWDLARAICDEADDAGFELHEAEQISIAALAHSLQSALLMGQNGEKAPLLRVHQPALDLAV